jgi:hypothetical protein
LKREEERAALAESRFKKDQLIAGATKTLNLMSPFKPACTKTQYG